MASPHWASASPALIMGFRPLTRGLLGDEAATAHRRVGARDPLLGDCGIWHRLAAIRVRDGMLGLRPNRSGRAACSAVQCRPSSACSVFSCPGAAILGRTGAGGIAERSRERARLAEAERK